MSVGKESIKRAASAGARKLQQQKTAEAGVKTTEARRQLLKAARHGFSDEDLCLCCFCSCRLCTPVILTPASAVLLL